MANLSRKTRNFADWASETTLPDEDNGEFIQFRDTLVAELAPRSAYAKGIATDIVFANWDILRHRRLMAALLRKEFRSQAERALPAPRRSVDEDCKPSIGHRLLEGEPAALRQLSRQGLTMSELSAAAFDARSESVAYHETRIADLERRRERLFANFTRIQALGKPSDIEDAVEVT